MQPYQIVVREMQGDRRLQVFQLLAESVRETSKTAHGHMHRQILTFHKTCRNILLVGVSGHHDLLLANHARGRVATGTNWLCIVKFNRLPVIDICTKCPFNGIHIGPERIRRNLHPVCEALGKITHERYSAVAGTLADQICWNQLGIGVDGNKGPLIANTSAILALGNVGLTFTYDQISST